MSLSKKLEAYLECHHYDYDLRAHGPTARASDNAKVLNWPITKVAKVIACKADGELIMLVLPANEKIHIRTLKDETGLNHVELLSEEEMAQIFPDTEIGALPAFASLYGMTMIISDHFNLMSNIAFNAGNHQEALIVPLQEIIETERPRMANFSVDTSDYEDYRSTYYAWA